MLLCIEWLAPAGPVLLPERWEISTGEIPLPLRRPHPFSGTLQRCVRTQFRIPGSEDSFIIWIWNHSEIFISCKEGKLANRNLFKNFPDDAWNKFFYDFKFFEWIGASRHECLIVLLLRQAGRGTCVAFSTCLNLEPEVLPFRALILLAFALESPPGVAFFPCTSSTSYEIVCAFGFVSRTKLLNSL